MTGEETKRNDTCPSCGAKDWKDTTDIHSVKGTWRKHRQCNKCGLKQSSDIF